MWGNCATGMRASELRDLVSTIDWSRSSGWQDPYESLSFRRKEDKRSFQNGLEFGLRNGFNATRRIEFGPARSPIYLDRVALAYSDLKSFDDLAIPSAVSGQT